ncbi:hypothetical protein CCHR01_17945 [Colletotrichum chrysophilum]|uniref:Uncharacterized protein n=1 Tax=Colletotrichum chrysophilum TaxID=1836956 RepID=A0AAD9A116_9PEZI|nr:hypothetical protein CCHR01_17945 [Colletotrichum chrysophilum]
MRIPTLGQAITKMANFLFPSPKKSKEQISSRYVTSSGWKLRYAEQRQTPHITDANTNASVQDAPEFHRSLVPGADAAETAPHLGTRAGPDTAVKRPQEKPRLPACRRPHRSLSAAGVVIAQQQVECQWALRWRVSVLPMSPGWPALGLAATPPKSGLFLVRFMLRLGCLVPGRGLSVWYIQCPAQHRMAQGKINLSSVLAYMPLSHQTHLSSVAHALNREDQHSAKQKHIPPNENT